MRALDPERVSAPGAGPGLDVAEAGRLMLDAAAVGLAVAERDSRAILMTNRRLRDWLAGGGAPPGTLDALLPVLDIAAMEARLAKGREYLFDMEAKAGRRPISLAGRITQEPREDGRPALLVELQNVSKLRELEYMLESYSGMVEKRNRELAAAKDRVERLLLNIMPKTVYEEWRRFGVTQPRLYTETTILMLDFVGFTDMAVTQDPPELIRELNDIFSGFDRIVEEFGCERLKTIGDAYMAVSGLPLETPDHAANVAAVALRLRRFLERRNETSANRWLCRIGVHSGRVVGSIVGVRKYVYDVFGPGVNTAARLEAMAAPMEILISNATRKRLGGDFAHEEVGLRDIRGKGPVRVFRLLGDDGLGA